MERGFRDVLSGILMSIFLAIHLICVSFFLGFLLLDVCVIRRFFDTQCHEKKDAFYRAALFSLAVCAVCIIVSGVALLWFMHFSPTRLIRIKIALALFAIILFFCAPWLVARLPKGSVHIVYGVILATAIAVVFLAVFGR